MVTDLPIAYSQYPSTRLGTFGPGIMLASYTWGDDALTWDSLSQQDRLGYTLKNLSAAHGSWNLEWDRVSVGYAFRIPVGLLRCSSLNKSRSYPHYVSTPQGRVLYAGEHASTLHGWIHRAIESGIRIAEEVNERN